MTTILCFLFIELSKEKLPMFWPTRPSSGQSLCEQRRGHTGYTEKIPPFPMYAVLMCTLSTVFAVTLLTHECDGCGLWVEHTVLYDWETVSTAVHVTCLTQGLNWPDLWCAHSHDRQLLVNVAHIHKRRSSTDHRVGGSIRNSSCTHVKVSSGNRRHQCVSEWEANYKALWTKVLYKCSHLSFLSLHTLCCYIINVCVATQL